MEEAGVLSKVPYVNARGDEVLSEYREHVTSATEPMFTAGAVWQLQRVPERDYERREFGREFVLVRYNRSMSQSFRAGEFTRETAAALRDMLDAAIT